MKLLLRYTILRRIITVPALVLVFVWVLGLLPLWLLIAAFVSRYVPGRWRVLRLAWFAMLFLALEVVMLASLFVLWVGFGFGWRLRGERSMAVHHRLAAWYLRRLVGSARFTFGLSFVMDDPEGVAPDAARPALVFSRHAGAGDSLLLVNAVLNGDPPRRPKIVLKDLLQLDPTIDVLLNRVGAAFVPSTGRAGDLVTAAIARMAREADARDALVLFPEGGNFTEGRREKAIAKLEQIGRSDLADRAENLERLLPPKVLGVSTAIDAAPTAMVVFVGHAGLERLSSARDIWKNVPMDHTIRIRIWRVPAEDVPPMPERETWLYEQWEAIDEWLGGVAASD